MAGELIERLHLFFFYWSGRTGTWLLAGALLSHWLACLGPRSLLVADPRAGKPAACFDRLVIRVTRRILAFTPLNKRPLRLLSALSLLLPLHLLRDLLLHLQLPTLLLDHLLLHILVLQPFLECMLVQQLLLFLKLFIVLLQLLIHLLSDFLGQL